MKQVIKLSPRARISGPMPQQARKRLGCMTDRAKAFLQLGTYTTQGLAKVLGATKAQAYRVIKGLRPHLLETRGTNLSFSAWKEGA